MSIPMSAAQAAQQNNRGPGGQYSFGTHAEAEAVALDQQAPKPVRIFSPPGAKDIFVSLPEDFDLPPYPSSYPPATVTPVLNDNDEWQTYITVEGGSEDGIWVSWNGVNEEVYVDEFSPLTEEQDAALDPANDGAELDAFREWAEKVHLRSMAATSAYTRAAVPEEALRSIGNFAAGRARTDGPESDLSHGQRNSQKMQEALSGYLKPVVPGEGEDARGEREDLFSDALANLRHWCDQNNVDFDIAAGRSETYFEDEKEEDRFTASSQSETE